MNNLEYSIHYYISPSSNRTLVHLLKRWGLQCTVVPMETSDPSKGLVIKGLSDTKLLTEHTIHLWEISRDKHASTLAN